MVATTLEQSRKLLEIGTDPNTADMYYRTIINSTAYTEDTPTVGNRVTEWDIPAWSLSALLGLMPGGTRMLKSAADESYHFDYQNKWFDNPTDAAFEMVVWLKKT